MRNCLCRFWVTVSRSANGWFGKTRDAGRFNRSRGVGRRKRANRFGFATLEPRQLLATVYLDPSNGVLTTAGGPANDVAEAQEIGGGRMRIVFTNFGNFDFDKARVSSLVFIGFAGDDTFTNNTDLPSRMFGQTGNDTLIGGSVADRLIGGPGNDDLRGNAGNDLLLGIAGNDTIRGGAGNDEIFGSVSGTNLIYGEDGNDVIFGGNKVDTIYAGDGADRVYALAGDDLIYSGPGGVAGTAGASNADLMLGLDGDDTIIGESGLDIFYGSNGNDKFYGGSGENRMHGQNGDDWMRGGNSNDLMWGGEGNDTLFGIGGDDYLSGGNGNDSLSGGDGSDRLLGEGGNDGLFGGVSFNDILIGSWGADRFLVSAGDAPHDLQSDDAVIRFTDTNVYWNNVEIEFIDQGLAALHGRTGSTRVFKDPLDLNPLTIEKVPVGSLGNRVRALNTLDSAISVFENGVVESETWTRKIKFADWDESVQFDNEWSALSIIHEIGHSWDSQFEIAQKLPAQAGLWNAFLDTGAWITYNGGTNWTQASTQTAEQFDRTWNPARRNFDYHVRTWWYSPSRAFPRDISTFNPIEDWSTAWESIFVDQLVENPTSIYAQQIPSKVAIINQLFDAL